MKVTKPNYDYSYIKEISSHGRNYTGEREGASFYSDIEELLDAFEHNYLATIKVLVVPLFEKGFKVFLNYQNKTYEFFNRDPNLTEMVLSYDHEDSKNYLKSYFDIDYDLLVDLRNASNNKKHDTFQKFYSLNKKQILSELFKFFVLLYKNINGVQVELPSDDFLTYYSSFDTFKSDRIEEVNSEVEKIRKKKVKAESDLLQAIEDKETVEADVEKTKKELDLVSLEIERKKLEAKELDERLSKRKTDLALSTATMANNDLFELASELISKKDFESAKRVFQNILNTNIQDLRGYIGLILCLYRAYDIDSLVDRAKETRIHLVNTSIYSDCQKFLKADDKKFVEDLALTIENEIAFLELKEAAKVNDFETMKSRIKYLESSNSCYELAEYKEFAEFEPLYLHAKNLYNNHLFDEAIKEIESIIPYKDSEKLSKKWAKDRDAYIKAEEKRLRELAEKERKEREEAEKREQERIKREQKLARQSKIDDANLDLEFHRFDDAIRKYNALSLPSYVKKAKECKTLYEKFKAFENGDITYEEYLRIRSSYSDGIVRLVELHEKSITTINEEQTITRLLNSGNYKDFLKAYSLITQNRYRSWSLYSSHNMDKAFEKIMQNGIDIEIVKGLYIKNEIPEAKEQLEKHIQKHVFVPIKPEVKRETLDFIIKKVPKENSIYAMAYNVKRNTLEHDIYYAVVHHGNYQEAIDLYDPKYSTDDSKHRYLFSLIKLSKKELLKKEDLFTGQIGRKTLIYCLDNLKNEKDPVQAEIDFLRFLLDVYQDTEYHNLLQQIIYISYTYETSKESDNSKSYSLYNKNEKRLELYDEYDVLSICQHIHNATQIISSINPIESSFHSEKTDYVSIGNFEEEKTKYRNEYNKLVMKSKVKLAIFLFCSILLPAGIVMSIFGFSGNPVLGVFGVFAIIFGIMFIGIFFAERGLVKSNADSYFSKNEIYSRVALINLMIVFALDSDLTTKSIVKSTRYSYSGKFVLDLKFKNKSN